MSGNSAAPAPLTGPEAFIDAVGELYVHFLVAIGIAGMMALLAVMADMLARREAASATARSFLARLRFDLVDYWLYCGAFSLFGLVTAYFLALGINVADETKINEFADTFATPLIALLTSGVAFVAVKTKSQITSNELVLGVLSFLIACVLSYHTHTKQRLDLKGKRPPPAVAGVVHEGAASPLQLGPVNPTGASSEPSEALSLPREEGAASPASSPPPPSPDAAGGP